MRTWVLLLGIAMIVVGLFGGIAASVLVRLMYDPVKDPVATIDGEGPVELKKGDYEIWIDESDRMGSLHIKDPQGNEVNVDSPKMSPSQKGYMADLKFTAPESGTYYFERNDDTTLYIMEPQVNSIYTLEFGPCCGGLVIAVLGIIVVVLGLVIKKKRK